MIVNKKVHKVSVTSTLLEWRKDSPFVQTFQLSHYDHWAQTAIFLITFLPFNGSLLPAIKGRLGRWKQPRKNQAQTKLHQNAVQTLEEKSVYSFVNKQGVVARILL